jgi:hypothetical protein
MTVAEANSILGMTQERLVEFISECRRNKTLSTMVQRANAALLSDDAEASGRARAVLARMGLLNVD